SAVAAAMAAIGARADIAGVDRRVHAQIAGATAAAQPLGPAVPRPLHATAAAIGGAERQADDDVDVLVGSGAVEQANLAVGHVRAGRGHDRAGGGFDRGIAGDAVGGIGGERRAARRGAGCRRREPHRECDKRQGARTGGTSPQCSGSHLLSSMRCIGCWMMRPVEARRGASAGIDGRIGGGPATAGEGGNEIRPPDEADKRLARPTILPSWPIFRRPRQAYWHPAAKSGDAYNQCRQQIIRRNMTDQVLPTGEAPGSGAACRANGRTMRPAIGGGISGCPSGLPCRSTAVTYTAGRNPSFRSMGRVMSGKIKKVVLAYSGGLDTSVILRWLQETYHCEVATFTADIGQGEELEPARQKAQLMGVKEIFIEDLREEFVRDFVFPMFRANALYEGQYLLGTSIARPLIAKRQIEIANQVGADAVAHGATGKGNDQVRFELTYYALKPDIKVIAPWREWELTSRSKLIQYAEKHQIPIPRDKRGEAPFSTDANLLHISAEGKVLEDPWSEPEEFVYSRTVAPEEAPDKPEYVEIEFKR